MSILKKLIKLSNNLDRQGLTQEADVLDKVAASWMQEAGFEESDYSDLPDLPSSSLEEQTEPMAILAHENIDVFLSTLEELINKYLAEDLEYPEALSAAMKEMDETLKAAQSDIQKEVDSNLTEYDREKNRLERMRKPEDMSSIFDMN